MEKKRYDSLIFKNIPSKIFNFAARKASGINLNDFNSGLKAYKKGCQIHRIIWRDA